MIKSSSKDQIFNLISFSVHVLPKPKGWAVTQQPNILVLRSTDTILLINILLCMKKKALVFTAR